MTRPTSLVGSRWFVVAQAAFFAAVLALVSGCSEKPAATNQDTLGNFTPTTNAPTCQRNEPGCPCAAEGKRIECGKVTSTDPTGKVTCGKGGQVCTGGKWSDCDLGAYAPGFEGVTKPQTLGTAGACTDACDLYCQTVHDTADETIPLGDGGLVYVDGGITLSQANRNPDGGPTPEDLAILLDSGGLPDSGPDAPALIFHELLPGEIAQDPVVLPPGEVPSTDIYFLLDDTASMYDESAALTSAIQASPSMIDKLRGLFNNNSEKVQFGFGRFEEYKQTKYVSDPTSNVAFQHILSISGDPVVAGIAAKWVREDSYGALGNQVNHTGGTFPESTTTALMMLATGGNDPSLGFGAAKLAGAVSLGAPNCNPNNWWVFPRECWGGTPINGAYFTTNGGTVPTAEYPVAPAVTVPCPAVSNPPAGYNPGYPCWRPNKTPIVIVLTDAPSHNGPNGQYGYKQVSGYGIQFAQGFPNAVAAPATVGVNDGSSFSKAITLPLPADGAGALYVGSVPVRNTPNGISASYVGGGVIKQETAIDNTGATYVARELVDTYPGTMTVGVPYRSTLRDCALTSVNVCVPGTTTYNTGNATSTQPQTAESVPAAITLLTPSTVATQVPGSQAYTATLAGTYSNVDTCTVDGTSATQANASYTSAGAPVYLPGADDVPLPNTLTQFGAAPVINLGQKIRFYLVHESPGQETIQARLRVRLGSAPTASTGTTSSSITNATLVGNSVTLEQFATANGQTFYVGVDRQLGTPSFPRISVRYEIFNAVACPASTILIEPTSNGSPRVCWTCRTGSGYVYTATCGAGTARAGLAGCFRDVPASCSGGSPATILCGGVSGGAVVPGSTTCCQAKTCAAGWVLNAAQTTCVRCNNAAYPNPNGSPPTLCAATCAGTWDGTANAGNCVPSCPAGTGVLDAPRDRCLLCPTATPAYSLNAAAATCNRNTCPAGWTGPSGGNCTRRSCELANACSAYATGYTCSGAPGAANCSPSCTTCGSSACTPTPAAPAAPTSVACTNPCSSTSSASRGDGYRYGEMIYRFTVPVKDATKSVTHPANRTFYHFALLRNAPGTATVGDSNAFLYIKPADAADANAANDTNVGGRVLDCNRDANKWNVIGNPSESERYKRAEINSYLAPGDYYLVIDNRGSVAAAATATSPAYPFILQVGAFDDAAPFAAPSYKQAVQALNSIGAKTIGIDSSGTSCQQAGLASNNAAGTETREFLEQLGRDTSSVDGVTGKPFVVPIRQNAGDCDGTAGANGLQTAVEGAVESLTKTLRQDITLRAVFANQPVTSPVFVPPVAPAQFIQNVEALPSTEVTENCGALPAITAIGNDVLPGYQKFQVCLPGTSVVFRVTFVMPSGIARLTYDQYFRFDLVILRGVGEVGRVPVVLKLPKLPVPGDFYRDYDMTNVCPAGTRIIWDRFGWISEDPQTDPSDSTRIGSKIDMNVIMGTSMADLVAKTGTPSEKSLATAKASPWPPNTEVGSATLGPILNYQRENFLRVHFRLSPSAQGAYPNNAIYVPTLRSWDLFISCPPSE